MTDFSTLTLEVEDGIAVATFNRPDKMNTFGAAMMGDMLALFDQTDADDDVRAVIVTGSGRAFCAGADLGRGGDTFDHTKRDASAEIVVDGVRRDGGGRVALRIYDSLKPVIAAVNGAAVGIGATMQLPMDARLASTSARFGFVFSRRGITPEACSSWFLPRLVGAPTALEWFYSGRVFDAQEALDKGLVQSLHAPEELLPAAKALAHRMTDDSAPVSVALSAAARVAHAGRAPRRWRRTAWTAAPSRRAGGRQRRTREGIASFTEKRAASYPDRVSADLPDVWAGRPRPEFS